MVITEASGGVPQRTCFNAAHHLHNPNWTDEKNRRVYGKCNNQPFLGHNYELIVQVIGGGILKLAM